MEEILELKTLFDKQNSKLVKFSEKLYLAK